MKIDAEPFRVLPGKKIELTKLPTKLLESKKHYKHTLQDHIHKLEVLQQLFYASDRCALLFIFQGIDAAGKDGAIRHVMSGVNPQGCQVTSFKQPSAEELQHDFLWRTDRHLPARGQIGIFNRSYYEEVLVVRVHPKMIDAEGLAENSSQHESFWTDRFEAITDSERHLHRSGTRTIKIFLHLSKGEQRRRFLERIDDPDKNWKLSSTDVKERKLWDRYSEAYAACLSATSTEESPWYVVPADDKQAARLIVSRIVLDALENLKMSYPKSGPQRLKELRSIRKELAK